MDCFRRIFIFSIVKLCHCQLLDGYAFPVYTTQFCPRNHREWNERSSAFNCTESNAYMCFPNENLTQLLEFCYKESKIRIQEGICLFLYKRFSLLDAYNCSSFTHGCPKTSHFSDEIYKYPNCVSLGEGCFRSEPFCNRQTLPVQSPEDNKLVWVVIPSVFLLIVTLIIFVVIHYEREFASCSRFLHRCFKLRSRETNGEYVYDRHIDPIVQNTEDGHRQIEFNVFHQTFSYKTPTYQETHRSPEQQ